MNAQEVILSVYWWTKFTGPEQTGTFVEIMGSGFQGQSLECQVKPDRQKQTKSLSENNSICMIATSVFHSIIYICPKQQAFSFLQNERQFLHI